MIYQNMSRDEQLELEDNYLKSAEGGNLEQLMQCIERGVPIEVVDEYGDTALHYATLNGRMNITQYLIVILEMYVDVRNDYGCTAFHYAITYGNIDIVMFLHCEGNCNVHIQSDDGENALHKACYNSHLDIVHYLTKECKIDINTQDC
jgi:ankyrin repeat protein